MQPKSTRKACLIVIDGWGVNCDAASLARDDDAIAHAATPAMTALSSRFPNTLLAAHGTAVGLPANLMGNSEVGHLNIGAGRVVYQDIVRIERAIADSSLRTNETLLAAVEKACNGSRRMHLVGLWSDGGVHSHEAHAGALLDAVTAASHGKVRLFVHAIADGRDTLPKSAAAHISALEARCAASGGVLCIASVIGRYYAMDRDARWERTCIAVEAMVNSNFKPHSAVVEGGRFAEMVLARYATGETDEFLRPLVAADASCRIVPGDCVLFFNYRSDRMRQLATVLCAPMPPAAAAHFAACRIPQPIYACSMTQYDARLSDVLPTLFLPQSMRHVLAEVLASHALKQCHVAETEKYAHVTFFFNGGREAPFDGEDRVLIASPKCATYDAEPAMSVGAVADAVAHAIASGTHDFVMCNFAPPDMVGHTGVWEATRRAVEATDAAVARVRDACLAAGDVALFVTADHGNAEKMRDDAGGPFTAHTCNPVPFIAMLPASPAIAGPFVGATLASKVTAAAASMPSREPALCDVAPTLLAWMGVQQPAEMDGASLWAFSSAQ